MTSYYQRSDQLPSTACLQYFGRYLIGKKHTIASRTLRGFIDKYSFPFVYRYDRQGVEWVITDYKVGKGDSKGKSELSLARSELEFISEKRDLAVEFIFCLVLVEILKQLSVHPGHEDLVQKIENLCFKHFRYRDT